MDLIPGLRVARSTSARAAGPRTLLTPAQRRKLAGIATRVELRPRTRIFGAGCAAEHVFIVGAGVVKAVHDLASGKPYIASFWFTRDVFGLAENGRYVYTTVAVTPVTLHRFPIEALRQALLEDAYLQLQFLTKITHEFRVAQRQKLLLIRRDAVGQVVMFLSMLARQERDAGVHPRGGIAIPMSRSDIANYLGITLEAVSRATRLLVTRGIIAIPERQIIRIVDRRRFDALAAKI